MCKKCKKILFKETLPFRKHVGSSLTNHKHKQAPLTLPSGNHYVGYWYEINSFGISQFAFEFAFILVACNLSDRLCCRGVPSLKDKCPITAQDLKDMYNGLVKHRKVPFSARQISGQVRNQEKIFMLGTLTKPMLGWLII